MWRQRKMYLTLFVAAQIIVSALAAISKVPEWSVQSLTGESVSLNCNGSDVIVNTAPNLDVKWHKAVSADSLGEEITNDIEGFRVETLNGITKGMLIVEEVNEQTSGVYVCMVYLDGELTQRIIRGVNYHEAEYSEMIDKYRDEIIVGAIAAVVCLVFFGGLCFVYRCRFKSQEDREKKRELKMKVRGFDNEEFIEDEKKSNEGPTHL